MGFKFSDLVYRLDEVGLNHAGAVDVSTYNASVEPQLHTDVLAPWARTVVVFASGGPRLWDAMLEDLRRVPSHFTDTTHPLDDFVRREIEGVSDIFTGLDHRWFFAASDGDVHLDFRRLAVLAGLGAPSRLGLVIHPKFGPWMGLRAACFLPLELPTSPPVADLCGECPAPCIEACPGDAFVHGHWDVGLCADFHRQSLRCAASCDARMACPVGVDARYPEDERRYHYDPATGRIRLAQLLNIEHDSRRGVGPDWDGWSTSGEDSGSDG